MDPCYVKKAFVLFLHLCLHLWPLLRVLAILSALSHTALGPGGHPIVIEQSPVCRFYHSMCLEQYDIIITQKSV